MIHPLHQPARSNSNGSYLPKTKSALNSEFLNQKEKQWSKLWGWWRIGAVIASSWAMTTPAIAQISSDGTLPTAVNRSENLWEITGGERVGDNLFHSFGEFSLPTGNTAYFNHASDVVNAISRVTGGSISEIDGLIRANGNANLILINPAGINFGVNARLEIGGSFLGTTAESLLFEDGTVLSSTDTEDTPLLTVSVPLGLQMGDSSGAIRVAGEGNQLSETILSSPLDLRESQGIEVEPNQTIALVGKEVVLDGGIVSAASGRIELGSVAAGEVTLNSRERGWSFSYDNSLEFADIELQSQALANASSSGSEAGGSIQVRGAEVGIRDGSLLLIHNTAETGAGAISVKASESITLSGANNEGTLGSSIINETFGAGSGGLIDIETADLSLSDRSFIATTTYGAGRGGNLNLRASDSVTIVGTGLAELARTFQLGAVLGTLQPSDRGTGLFSNTAQQGVAGNIDIDTNSLFIANGGTINSPTFTTGMGGDINISAADIDLAGSSIQAGAGVTTQESGSAGDINLKTETMTVRDGSIVIDLTFGNADGGDINISATESLAVQNSIPGSLLFTGIYVNTSLGSGAGGDISISTGKLNLNDAIITNNTGSFVPSSPNAPQGIIIGAGGPGGDISIEATESIEIQGILFDPRFASGIGTNAYSDSDAGNISIITERLTITEGGDILTATLRAGEGGRLTIDASESIEIVGTTTADGVRRGGLFATSGLISFPDLVATGSAGAIDINTPDLTIRDGASIDVQSLGRGGTGELSILADSILLDNQGAISAETQSGVGGNIFLEADNIFWRRQSTTTASAGGSGDGGNIVIRADNLVALEESRLIADAAEGGDGGNIFVDTQSLFICSTCEVSASSTLGVDGIVTFSILEPEPNLETINLPEQPAQPEEVVSLACAAEPNSKTSELTITGRGGLPPRPSELLSGESALSFEKAVPSARHSEGSVEVANSNRLPPAAKSWYVNSEGVVVLAARTPDAPLVNSPIRYPDCHDVPQ